MHNSGRGLLFLVNACAQRPSPVMPSRDLWQAGNYVMQIFSGQLEHFPFWIVLPKDLQLHWHCLNKDKSHNIRFPLEAAIHFVHILRTLRSDFGPKLKDGWNGNAIRTNGRWFPVSGAEIWSKIYGLSRKGFEKYIFAEPSISWMHAQKSCKVQLCSA